MPSIFIAQHALLALQMLRWHAAGPGRAAVLLLALALPPVRRAAARHGDPHLPRPG
ncbi:hypothetical protein P3W85_30290 [Cupriavidus basilensis]|uniref:Uncharacterized protein n=1 Tax=Cupriavidus basilensis TaxID=68895 RepID=A0ABT6AX98_9BURK|nr:hypothetical protein [Cupriavidus basilensis]MDF3837213.1 hypothetical protein [Cupriavidus basilensis]